MSDAEYDMLPDDKLRETIWELDRALDEARNTMIMPLAWTTDRPTVPGWYWVKGGPTTCGEVVVYQITDDDDRGPIVDGDTPIADMPKGNLYAGPIPEPEEA